MTDVKVTRPYRADQVGSYLRTDPLIEARQRRQRGEIDAKQLRAVEDKEIRELVKAQEDIGLRCVTDGEFRRQSWNKDFLAGFDNVVEATGNLKLFHRNADGTNTSNQISGWAVTGKIARSHPIQVEDFKFLKATTKVTPKTCIPSPTLLHFRGGRAAIDQIAYPDIQQFFTDAAKAYNDEIKDLYAAGARYIQLDDTNFAYLCDPKYRDAAKAMGEDPAELVKTYCKLVNDSIANKPSDLLIGIHLCRGNSLSGAASGGYDAIAEQMFGSLNVDAYFLEYDDGRSGDFAPLRFVPKGKSVVLGLVTTKRAELEPKDMLKRRIEEASKLVPFENLCISPQCGFASGSSSARRRIEISDEMAKLRLVVETAQEVWGGM